MFIDVLKFKACSFLTFLCSIYQVSYWLSQLASEICERLSQELEVVCVKDFVAKIPFYYI